MKNYEINDKLVYYPVLKDQDYSIDILDENLTLDEVRPYLKKYIENDPNCIQFEKRCKNKPKTEKYMKLVMKKKESIIRLDMIILKKKVKVKNII
jgi:hypothetical protein